MPSEYKMIHCVPRWTMDIKIYNYSLLTSQSGRILSKRDSDISMSETLKSMEISLGTILLNSYIMVTEF